MQTSLRFCWLLAFIGLQAVPTAGVCGLDALDASALIHRSLQVTHAPSEGFKDFWHRVVMRVTDYLQQTESQQEANRKEVLVLKEYVDNLQSSFGKRGTLFSELQGFMPAGQADDADRQMGLRLLGLLRNKAFSKALHVAIGDIGRNLASYSARTEKRMEELMLFSANTTEQELPSLINKFFASQEHIMSNLVSKMDIEAQKVISELPEEYAYFAEFVGPLINQLANYTAVQLAHYTKLITDSNGTQFCGGLNVMLLEQFLPVVNQTMQAIPQIEVFVRSNAPDLAADIKQAVGQVSDIASSTLSSLKKHAQVWSEQVCGLIAAASASA